MKVIILSYFFCLCFSIAAQQDKITSSLNSYFDLIEKKEISTALDYVHPGLIEMLGKEMFEQQYNQLFNAPGVEISMGQFSVDTVSAIHEFEQVKYALVNYSFQMTFKVDLSNDDSGLLADVLLGSYKSKFGKDNVISEIPGTYLIHTPREMFAVSNPDFEGWKILDYETGMRIILVSIIPEAVLTHFKK